MYPRCLLISVSLGVLLVGCGGTPESSPAPGDRMHVSCLDTPNMGRCRAERPAFYYDYPTDRCRRFNWGGCGGKVPFMSMDDCVKTCGGRPAP